MPTYELPLIPGAQKFTANLGGANYALSLAWCDPAQCWTLDIATASGVVLVSGVPMVTGANLLGQFGHLGIRGELWAYTEGNPDAIPPYNDLGTVGKLLLVTA